MSSPLTGDPSGDPDRYDASRDNATGDDAPGPALEPSADPDRYRSPTLPGLLGEGSQEGERNNLTWLLGLLAVFGFLLAVSLLVRLGTPG